MTFVSNASIDCFATEPQSPQLGEADVSSNPDKLTTGDRTAVMRKKPKHCCNAAKRNSFAILGDEGRSDSDTTAADSVTSREDMFEDSASEDGQNDAQVDGGWITQVPRKRRTRASNVLSAVATAVGSPRLATLAVKVRLDAFTRVKKAIDDMIAQLLQEKADEIKHKDFCVDEFNKNQIETERKEREKADLIAKIEDLTMTIEKLTKAIDTLKAEVAEMQVQLKRAGEDREKQNKEFQATVADQRETQKLLKAALSILGDFYNKEKAAMMQTSQEPAGPPPPAGFEAYKKNAASGGVMQMLEQIINDAKAMEAETIRAEEDAQKAYEDFVKDTNASIEAASKSIVMKTEEKAQAESDKAEAEEALASVELELDALANYKLELHQSCDFVQKNFEIRQTARDEEIEALKQAKAILSGAKFEAFLQIRR